MFFGKQIRYQRFDQEADESLLVVKERDESVEVFWRRAFFTLLISSISIVTLVGAVSLNSSLQPGLQRHYIVSDTKEPYSPVPGHIGYSSRWLEPDHKFTGSPRPELEEAWSELLRGTLIRVSEKDLTAANTTSIALKDGGYASTLGVGHGLHCLKRIRMAVHRSHYYPADVDSAEIERHTDHCLEWLRQLLMCKPDLGLYSLAWSTESRGMYGGKDAQPHVCVDYDALHQWMLSRGVSVDNFVELPDEAYQDHDLD